MKRRSLILMMVVVALLTALAACDDASPNTRPEIVHVEDGAAETQVALTAAALQPTAEPTAERTPIPEGTPYVMPTLDPELDPDMVITRVGNEEFTLADYQKHVRFERWMRLYALANTVEKHGTETILDLTKPENQLVASLFATLADSYSFGRQVHRVMVIDAISLQEAVRRGMEVDPFQFDSRLAQFLNQQVGEGGKLPEGFDEDYAEFLEGMMQYSGMTEEEFRRMVRARVLYSQLKFQISQSPEAVPDMNEARVGMEVRDITVQDRDEAQQIADRLNAGEELRDIALSLGFQASSENVSRVLRWSDESLPQDVMTAIANAATGTVVGPFLTPQGWYVARVMGSVFDALSPRDLDAMRERYFLDWIEAKMDDLDYVEDFENWIEETPQEPLPQDVSPLLQDQYVIVPEGETNPLEGFEFVPYDPRQDAEPDATETAEGGEASE